MVKKESIPKPLAKKEYPKRRIQTRAEKKANWNTYRGYKALINTTSKDPLKKLPIYNVDLYKQVLSEQELLLGKKIHVWPVSPNVTPVPQDRIDSVIKKMAKVYEIEEKMIYYCQSEWIDNPDDTLKSWKSGGRLERILVTGFLVCGMMEGYFMIHGSVFIEKWILCPIYKGAMKMNMKHGEKSTFLCINENKLL